MNSSGDELQKKYKEDSPALPHITIYFLPAILGMACEYFLFNSIIQSRMFSSFSVASPAPAVLSTESKITMQPTASQTTEKIIEPTSLPSAKLDPVETSSIQTLMGSATAITQAKSSCTITHQDTGSNCLKMLVFGTNLGWIMPLPLFLEHKIHTCISYPARFGEPSGWISNMRDGGGKQALQKMGPAWGGFGKAAFKSATPKFLLHGNSPNVINSENYFQITILW